MLSRSLVLPIDRSCLLLGPRQTGKTTLVKASLPADAWTVDLLHHENAIRYAKDPGRFRREAESRLASGTRVVFVDEVQKVPEILDAVQALLGDRAVRFILTGSSARKLKRGGANLLAGRAVVRRLHPLTFEEPGASFELERTLRLGSLPPVVVTGEEAARDFLRAYVEVYLREEIQAEGLVRHLGGFARFLDVVAAQCGDILNFSSIGRDAALATRTVQSWYEILEETLVGFRLEAWRKSPRARLVAHPRFYLFDTGITNALNRRLTAELDSASYGRLFEQWLILECVRRIDYRQSEARLFYWRTNIGAEVDLIVERHGEIRLAAEFKYKTTVVGADCTGLRSFSDAHPGVPCVVASLVPEPYDLGGIRVLPWREFFARFDSVLGADSPPKS